MQILEKNGQYLLEKAGCIIGRAALTPTAQGAQFTALCIDPAWRRRGYGTYLLRELLRRTGGFARDAETLHTAPLPAGPDAAGELAFWARQGFAPQGGRLMRRRVPDLTAVKLAQEFVAGRLAAAPGPLFCVDATCGNGHDTAFLCRTCAALAGEGPRSTAQGAPSPAVSSAPADERLPGGSSAPGPAAPQSVPPKPSVDAPLPCPPPTAAPTLPQEQPHAAPPPWQVLAMDIQPQAAEATRARLTGLGFAAPQAQVVCGDHAHLLAALPPACADAILFNFGWLPGADHGVFSTAASSIPALEAALAALKPGGVLSAVLYSGKTIGSGEKQAVLAWLRALPLTGYTVLVCDFANWADTAPLPCFVLKK